MADWDADSPRLRQNLIEVLRDARDRAVRRDVPTVEDARRWQRDTMAGLTAPDEKHVGRFRGEAGLETTHVWVGSHEGVAPESVDSELAAFERTLQRVVAALDARYPRGQALDRDGLAAVIDLCAWTHAEWIRIHPFANGNGRTARIWANALLMRYGLPPVVRLRPRPDGGYGRAGAAAMEGDWRPTAVVFRRMLGEPLTS
ncbi:MAG: Fic family protein [Acidobacteria bacterium]|nr:Fic family protein [Acidobacteriota bacterium]